MDRVQTEHVRLLNMYRKTVADQAKVMVPLIQENKRLWNNIEGVSCPLPGRNK